MAPLGTCGTGAILHFYPGVSPAAALTLTVVAAVQTITVTAVWAVITLQRARSDGRIRSAVLKQEMSAGEAAALLGEPGWPPARPADDGADVPVRLPAGRQVVQAASGRRDDPEPA